MNDRATIPRATGRLGRLTVGAYAFVGAGAVVQRDIPDFALVVGVPARQIGWMSAFGEKLDLPLTGYGETRCPKSGDSYVLDNNRVTRMEQES